MWSTVSSFRSAPNASTPEAQNRRWVIYGDMGTVIPFGAKVTDLIVQGA